YDSNDDYPDFVILLARAVAAGTVERGVLLCGSGIGGSIAANKVDGVRAAVCHDDFSARQGVEDDDMNILCLGGRTTGIAVAWDCVRNFLAAKFTGASGASVVLLKSARFAQIRWPPFGFRRFPSPARPLWPGAMTSPNNRRY
ncbi:MAG: RpiB/LacA/LacB family sugar-phosphate isomerase, partial [Terriglobales bacterium]